MVPFSTIKQGFMNGLKVTWELTKVVVPVYISVTILKYTPVLPWISKHMEPVMKLVGLPGEASLPLVLGYCVNIYAAIGAITPLNLNIKQITIIAAMLLLAHSLPMETAINKKTGVRVTGLVVLRLLVGFAIAVGLNIFI